VGLCVPAVRHAAAQITTAPMCACSPPRPPGLPNPCPPRSLPQQALSGLARISNVGVEAIAGMGQLQQLELRLGGPQAVHW